VQIIKAARGRITGVFGAENVPGSHVKSHLGIDLGHGDKTAADLDLVAPAGGIVRQAGPYGTYGNRVEIDHGIVLGNRWTSLVAHLARIDVVVGQTLKQGEHLGVMGSTGGNWPVHCHQELRKNGVQVDPALYLHTPEGDEMELTDRIKHRDIDLTVAEVLGDTLFALRDCLVKQDRILEHLSDLIWTKHRTVDAPVDVVNADALLAAQDTSATANRIEAAVTSLLARIPELPAAPAQVAA
jgi:hypothetical protein